MAHATPRRSQVSPRTVWTVGLNALGLLLIVYVLRQTWTVVSWILLATLLALALDPLIEWLSRRGLRRGAAIALVLGAFVGTATLFVVTLVPLLVSQAQQLVQRAPSLVAALREHAWVKAADERFQVVERAQEKLRNAGPLVAMPLLGLLRDALSGVVAFFTILTLTVFMLLFGGEVRRATFEWIAPERRPQAQRVADAIHEKVGGYVLGTLLMALIGGVVTSVTALVLGVPYFLPLGLAMMFLTIVPFIGSFVGVTLLVSTALATQGTKTALIALAVLVIYGQLKTKLLAPLIQRHTVKMNPLIITLVMLVGTALAGVLGTLIALPFAGAIQVLLQEALAYRQARWRQVAVPEAPPAAPEAPPSEAHPPH